VRSYEQIVTKRQRIGLASTPDSTDLAVDPGTTFSFGDSRRAGSEDRGSFATASLPSRGELDPRIGGTEIDQALASASRAGKPLLSPRGRESRWNS